MTRRQTRPAADATTATAPTLAEAIDLVGTWTDLSEERRRLMVTAIRSLAHLEGKPVDTVRLDPVRSVALMEQATPAALDIAQGTLTNRRTAIRQVLTRLGLLAPRRVRTQPTQDPAWAALLEPLPGGKDFGRLRAFAADCAAQGIAPERVDGATLDAYAERRAASHGGTRSRDHARRVATQWNRAGREIPGWPAVRIGLTAVPLQRTLPFEAYPPILQAEAQAYLAEIGRPETPDDDLFAGRPIKRVEATTVRSRMYGLRGLLFGGVQSGIRPEAITSLGQVVRPDFVKAAIRWHYRRKGNTVTADLGHLAATTASVAAWLDLPKAEMTALKAILARVKPPPRKTITDRTERILQALDDPATRARFLHLPEHVMTKAARLRDGWVDAKDVYHPPRPAEAAWIAAIGVAMEILLHAPMRIENLHRMRLGDELRFDAPGRSARRGTILVHDPDSKNGIGLEVPIGPETVARLRDYLEGHRPTMRHADTAWLFPGLASPDQPRNKSAFGTAITEALHEGVGLRINPHAFRAIAGAFILEADPNAIDDLRALLGHAGFETALRYYRRVNQRGAAERLSSELARQRTATRRLGLVRSPLLGRTLRAGRPRRPARGAAPGGESAS